MDLMQVIDQIGREKGIEKGILIEAVGAAILSASRKSLPPAQAALDLRVDFDGKLGQFTLYAVKKIVEAAANPKVEISLEEALQITPGAQIGDEMRSPVPVPAHSFGRIAAQTAKQVIIQRVREAERDSVYQTFKEKEGELVHGVVQRVIKGNAILNIGKAEAILPVREQLPREEFRVGDRVRAYILDVKKTSKGSQIVVSRTHPGFVKRLFELEVPEIYEGIVEVRAAAREAGERAKIAVSSKDGNVDPVGACVGYRGARVQAIVRELQGEKIDIIPWREDPAAFVKAALAPAEVQRVSAESETRTLRVVVADDQLSLAIGRRGQNARLAAKLVGWKVDIRSTSELQREAEAALSSLMTGESRPEVAPPPDDGAAAEQLTSLPGVGEKLAMRLVAAGYTGLTALAEATPEALQEIEGIGPKSAEKILLAVREALADAGVAGRTPGAPAGVEAEEVTP
ncbi:MAG: transcription termination/antitermination protein NusA [candidate division NC10 bacterium]|nr:transcription termination/antitermination protein NusA [candidate division NC10 bacterium]